MVFHPTVEATVNQIHVKPGSVVTVYLGDFTDKPNGRAQIELRVRHNGTREVFLDITELNLHSFDDWRPLDEAGGG